MATKPLCSIPDCGKAAEKRGWCGAHYRRWQRHGDPGTDQKLRPSPGSRIEWIRANSRHGGSECLRWPFPYDPNGYGQVSEGGVTIGAHRAMCIEANGPPPTENHEAAHSCGKGNEGCLNGNHLRWALPIENQNDRVAHGTHNRGTRAHAAKLTEDEVRAIRAMEGVESAPATASRFGISKVAVRKIQRRENWAWLE